MRGHCPDARHYLSWARDLGSVIATPLPPTCDPSVKQGGPQPALPTPDAEDLLRVFLAVGRGGDNQQAVQQINGDAMGALVAGAPDAGEVGKGKLSG